MKKKFFSAASAVLMLLMLLTGCARTRSVLMGMINDMPYWYYNPESRVSKSEAAFVGEGSSTESSRQAELVSYSDLFRKLEEYVGTELSREYYRELINLGTIEELGLRVVISDMQEDEKTGEFRSLILCGASKQILTSMRTEAKKEEYDKEEQVISLIREGDSCVRESRDFQAVKLYLKSMILSHDLVGLDEEYSYYAILDEVKQILSTLSLRIVSSNRGEASCSVLAQRRETILRTKVNMADIRASYICVDGLGNTWEDYYVFSTDSDGLISFRPVNYTLSTVGNIEFTFDIYEELEQIKAFDAETASVLGNLIEESKAVFSYEKTLNSDLIGLQILLYDSSWSLTGETKWVFYMQSRLHADSVASYASYNTDAVDINADGDLSDKEILSFFRKMEERKIDSVLVLRMGVLRQLQSDTGVWLTVVESSASYYEDLSSSAHENPVMNVSGFGATAQESLENACRNTCNIIYDWIKGNYV